MGQAEHQRLRSAGRASVPSVAAEAGIGLCATRLDRVALLGEATGNILISRSPSSALSHPLFVWWGRVPLFGFCLGGGSPTKIDHRKRLVTLILTSPLEDPDILSDFQNWVSLLRSRCCFFGGWGSPRRNSLLRRGRGKVRRLEFYQNLGWTHTLSLLTLVNVWVWATLVVNPKVPGLFLAHPLRK